MDHSSADPVRVFLDDVEWFVRPQNTDWRYVRFAMRSLSIFESRIELYPQRSFRILLQENGRYVFRRIAHKLRYRPVDTHRTSLDFAELRRSGCDVVFSHRGFPCNAGPYPVVWQNSILDPEMCAYYDPYGLGVSLQMEIDSKGPLFARAAVVNVSTEAEVRRLSRMFPDLADRFFYTPFFVPEARAADAGVLEKHRGADEIRILFVGREAKRKGLDLLLEAFQKLPASVRKRARLVVISARSDGEIVAPSDSRVEIHEALPHERVMSEMRRAHVLAVPSRFESYGLVYLEAMSQGAVPVASNWEVQRELLSNGEAGVLVKPGDAGDLALQLERLIEDETWRVGLAQNGYREFRSRYAPEKVASRFLQMFQLARLGRGNA